MNTILLKMQMFFEQANRGEVTLSDELLDEFAAMCRHSLQRQFNERRRDEFTLRMSNVGRPLCQLQMEKSGAKAEPPGLYDLMRNSFGDITEAMAVVLMKAAGVGVVDTQGAVEFDGIKGTYDIKIDEGDGPEIYDIKSASPYAFTHKFSADAGGYTSLADHDTFGYVVQGFGYAAAENVKFKGWIAIDKSSGEWNVLETPEDDHAYTKARLAAMDTFRNTKHKLETDAPFERCYTDKPEVYYKQETGNRVLDEACSWCSYKHTCWPDLKTMPSAVSAGFSPRIVHYTHFDKEATDKFIAQREAKKKR